MTTDETIAPAAPESGDLTYENARELVRQYIKESGKSQNAVAKELGLQNGTGLSQFLSGTYATPHKFLPKIQELMRRSELRKASPAAPPFAMTTNSQRVTMIITYCHIQGKVAVAYGDAGTGKTMACMEYRRQNLRAILITPGPLEGSAAAMTESLGEELKIEERLHRRIHRAAVEKLKDSDRVVIVDEAQHLSIGAIDYMRDLSDKTGVGVALVGNESLFHKVQKAAAAGYAQITNRACSYAEVSTSSIKRSDIDLVFADVGLNDESLELLYKISRTFYGMRGVVNVYTNTILRYEITDPAALSAGLLAKSARDLKIVI